MTDRLTVAQRSRLMSRVRNRNTVPELTVRRLIHRMGYRFRLHRKDLPGRPDIVLPKHKKVIFVHGCFWHGHECPRGKRPASNQGFWNQKIDRNRARDASAIAALKAAGWNVLVLWDCQIKQPELLNLLLAGFLHNEATHER